MTVSLLEPLGDAVVVGTPATVSTTALYLAMALQGRLTELKVLITWYDKVSCKITT